MVESEYIEGSCQTNATSWQVLQTVGKLAGVCWRNPATVGKLVDLVAILKYNLMEL